MSADLPNPVAVMYDDIDKEEFGVFSESQLREYAEAKCAELRTVMAQMAEALERAECWVTGPFAAQKMRAALSAYKSLGEQSAREPRQ